MKGRIIVVVILLFLFTLPAYSEESRTLNIGTPFQYAVQDDGVWIHTDGQLNFYNDEGHITASFVCDSVAHMSTSENTLFLHIKTADGQSIRRVDMEGNVIEAWSIPDSITIGLFEMAQNGIVILNRAEESDAAHGHLEAELYFLSFENASVEKLEVPDWENSHIGTFAFDGEVLATQNQMTGEMQLLDMRSKQVIDTYSAMYEYIYLDNERGILYGFVEDGRGGYVESLSFQSGQRRLIEALPSDTNHAGLRGNDEYLYVEDYLNGKLNTIPIANLPALKTLTIVGFFDAPTSPRVAKAVELFGREYPGVEVVYENEMDTPALAAALMAGDPDIDILSVQEYGAICSKVMMKAGALLDLNEYPEIANSLQDWIDLDGIFVDHGLRFGVPVFVSPYAWRVNEALLDGMGLSIPEENWTWADFFTLCEQVDEYNQKQGKQNYVLSDSIYPYILLQYTMNAVDVFDETASFDTPDFRMLMERWKAAYDKGLLALDIDHYFLSDEERSPALFRQEELIYSEMGDNRYIMPPSQNEHTRYPTRTMTLVINKHSSNADMAAKFLSYYLSAEAVSAEDYVGNGRFLSDVDLYTAANKIDPLRPSEENEQFWVDVLRRGVQEAFYSDIMRTLTMELYPQYMDNEITLDQMITTIQTQSDMAMGE